MPKTDQLFQCHVNKMSLLWSGLITNHWWWVLSQINSCLVKGFLTDCQHNEIGNIFHSIMRVDLMISCSSLMVSISCSVHVAFETQLESLAKTLLLLEVLVYWQTRRNSKDNLFGQEIILTPKRQSHLMQRFLEFFPWWGLPFHTVLLNVLLPDQNWMLCDIVTVLAQILLQEHLLSLKIC